MLIDVKIMFTSPTEYSVVLTGISLLSLLVLLMIWRFGYFGIYFENPVL